MLIRQDWTFTQFHGSCRRLTLEIAHPVEEFHERPVRDIYPIAGGNRSGSCSQSFAR